MNRTFNRFATSGSNALGAALIGSAVVLCLLTAIGTRAAIAADSPLSADALRVKQETQQTARDMARELVSGILDVQLKQLEQNGLQKLDLYRDIQMMRNHIDGLVEAEMRDVVEILIQAQKADPATSTEQFTKARAKIREIVTRLAAERQNLARRLRVAELAAQVKMLIERQTAVKVATESLAEQPRQRQAELTLDTIQNQNDVKELFIQLVSALTDVATWGGQVGAGAADGLRILKAGQAGLEIDDTDRALDSARFGDAVKIQQSVITTLKALLEKLEGIQGLINSSNEEALALVRELMKRQEEVRNETKQTDLNDRAAEKLVDQEAQIRKDLSRLGTALARLPAAVPVLEQAKAATFAATGDLFDAKKPEALDQESRAIGNLSELERKLEQASEQDSNDKSAAELAQEVKNLERAQKQIAEAQQALRKAADAAQSNAAESSKNDQTTADALATAAEPKPLPAAVKSRLSEAQAAAQDAAIAEAGDQPADAKRAAQNSAQDAIERADAETAAALGDTKLNEKAVSAGELARAAEALERAAAAERELARATDEAANENGLSAADAQKLAQDQVEVKKVAEKVAEGVKDRAPNAANALVDAQQPINDAGHDLVAAEGKAGEANKPETHDASQKGAAAANKLAAAAAEIRKQVASEANELAKIADEQLKPVAEARDKVEKATTKQTESVGSALDKLNRAEEKVAEAAAQEQRAEGHSQTAAAQEIAQQIAKAVEQQNAADQAAKDLLQGKNDSSFEAATSEQKVADMANDIARKTTDAPLQEALDNAQRAASAAAKNTIAGSPRAADAARQEAGKALDKAQKLAQDEAKKSTEVPAGPANAAAEKRAAEAAAEAEKLTADSAPDAAKSLDDAAHEARKAEQALGEGNKTAAGQAQASVDQKLQEAASEIDQAKQAVARRTAGQLSSQSRDLGRLAKDTAPIDPDAAAALKDAQKVAAQSGETHVGDGPRDRATGSASSPKDAAQAAASQTEIGTDLDRADASLAARQQRLENAKELANQIAADASQQQQARHEIAADAARLNEAAQHAAEQAAKGGEHPAPNSGQGQSGHPQPSPAQQAAARDLQNAESRFADAQRKIGENAEQVSGQAEVANKPIREGLEAASRLADWVHEPSQIEEPGQDNEPIRDENANRGEQQRQGAHSWRPQRPGTGIIPSSPETTSEQIAGAQASAEVLQALKLGQESGKGNEQGQGDEPGQGQGQDQVPAARLGDASAASTGQAGSRSGLKTNNQRLSQGPSQTQHALVAPGDNRTPDDNSHDTDAAPRPSKEYPWLENLPPYARNALRAKSHQPAPRVYEDRLKKYFENIEK
ncbi:MAG TPA: hypothetical protein VG056_09210 [Pirellulales bacterium]|nr:hypothetical protein [Pirellulales bacterium]